MIKLPKPVNQSLAADIAALDCRYRGSPSYEHDAAYMRKAAENLVLKGYSIYTESQLKQAVRDAGGFHACLSSGVFVPAGIQLYAAPIPQQVAVPAECCEHCDDGDGLCVFPMYGPAPHTHDTSSGWIGSTRTLPKDQWGNNFREDPDCEGHGVYMRCEKCGRGEQPAAAAPQPKEPK